MCFQEGGINKTVEASKSQVTESDLDKPDQNVTAFVIPTPPVKENPKSEKHSVVLKDKVEEVVEVVQESSPPSPPSNVVVQQQQQTTWQKLSARIKALEWNVTMSTGFLEELSLKYIQQTEELNTAVKAANEAIAGVVKREEVMKETMEERERHVIKLVAEVEEMRELVERSREEVVTRHGLLLLLEGCVLGLLLVCCRGGRGREREIGSRRVSLELSPTQQQQQGSRRQSYEPPSTAGLGGGDEEQQLSKRQKKRKRRRESASLLRYNFPVPEQNKSFESSAVCLRRVTKEFIGPSMAKPQSRCCT